MVYTVHRIQGIYNEERRGEEKEKKIKISLQSIFNSVVFNINITQRR